MNFAGDFDPVPFDIAVFVPLVELGEKHDWPANETDQSENPHPQRVHKPLLENPNPDRAKL